MKEKLRSSSGASMMIAMVFMMLCVFFGGAVLAAATANGGRAAQQKEKHQQYLTQRSLADVLQDSLCAPEGGTTRMTIVLTETVYTPAVYYNGGAYALDTDSSRSGYTDKVLKFTVTNSGDSDASDRSELREILFEAAAARYIQLHDLAGASGQDSIAFDYVNFKYPQGSLKVNLVGGDLQPISVAVEETTTGSTATAQLICSGSTDNTYDYSLTFVDEDGEANSQLNLNMNAKVTNGKTVLGRQTYEAGADGYYQKQIKTTTTVIVWDDPEIVKGSAE